MPDSAELDRLVLRESDETDIPAITAIYRQAVLTGCSTLEIEPPSEAEMKIRRRLLLAANYPFLVAESDGKVVGFAFANLYRQRPAYAKTVENSIYVREGVQGRGVGARLLSALIAETSSRGFRQMIAVIGDAANEGSIRLHAKLGFAIVGRLGAVGAKQGRWLDTVLMQLPLGVDERQSS
ncbi:GNAT family N-acetyltransferase [Methylocapsa acidiphila]|uniref:GNAT family N-acetyltransferase n=1 Tax=Methylocapsa acidiphila TaxID=133552 RepID=UPI00042994DC|nr:GNAT family N-acetyltransferase [Methylocapsa acidiphila]